MAPGVAVCLERPPGLLQKGRSFLSPGIVLGKLFTAHPRAWAVQPSSGQPRQFSWIRSVRFLTSRSRARCSSCSASMVSVRRRMSAGRSSIVDSAAARAITLP